MIRTAKMAGDASHQTYASVQLGTTTTQTAQNVSEAQLAKALQIRIKYYL